MNFRWRFNKTPLTSCGRLETTVKPHLDRLLIEQASLHFVIREKVKGTSSILEDCSQVITLILFPHGLAADVFNI